LSGRIWFLDVPSPYFLSTHLQLSQKEMRRLALRRKQVHPDRGSI
jgi:hypothetical protein